MSPNKIKYLVTVMMNREWRILKEYIPPTLFIETNLPSIRIIDPEAGDVINEDAPLALTMYVPGKPLFRIGGRCGAFIPIRKRGREQVHYAIINNLYTTSILPKRSSSIFKSLPEEYVYFVDQVLRRKIVEVHLLDEINPEKFYVYGENDRKCYTWFSWLDGSMFSLIDITRRKPPKNAKTSPENLKDVKTAIRRAFYRRGYYNLRAVEKSSNSFGRFAVADIGLKTLRDYEKYRQKLNRILSRVNIEIMDFCEAEMLKLLYAIDFYLKLDRIRIQAPSQLERVLSESCIDDDVVSSIIGTRKPPREIRSGTRILGKVNSGNVVPTVLGYKINDTRLVKLEFKEPGVSNFVNQILEHTIESRESSDDHDVFRELCSFNKLYTMLTVNQVVVDMLRFYLSNDLTIITITAGSGIQLEPLVNATVAYVDLYMQDKTADILYKSCEKAVETIINNIRSYLRSLREKDRRALAVKYYMYGERIIVPQRINFDETDRIFDHVKERLQYLLCDSSNYNDEFDWRCELLKAVLLHTFDHHLISVLSSRSRIPVDYLLEMYDFTLPYSYVFESVSGGIGAIDTATKYWKEHLYDEALEDLILKFGSCLLGSPEDLVYFAILNTSDYKDERSLKEGINNTIKKLGLVFTPSEYNEAIKLYYSVLSEAQRLALLLGTGKGGSEWKLLKDAVRARYDCERRFKRFCTSDEITLYLFRNLNRYGTLRDLLISLVIRYLETKTKRLVAEDGKGKEKLTEIYGVSNINKLAEELVGDLRKIVNGIEGRLDIANKVHSRIVIDIVRALKSALIRLYLKSCNGACSLCYLNTRSCRFTAPWIQMRTLNRRLAKLYVSHAIQSFTGDIIDTRHVIGKIVLKGTARYLVST